MMGYTVFSRGPANARIDAGSPHSWRPIFGWGEEKGSVAPQTLETAWAHCLGAVESAYRRETAIPAGAVAMQKYIGCNYGRRCSAQGEGAMTKAEDEGVSWQPQIHRRQMVRHRLSVWLSRERAQVC